MRNVLLLLVTVFSALFSCAAPAFAWGCDGHQIVALIARAHLTPAVSAAVDRLLRENPIDPALNRFCTDRPMDLMADSATWADDERNVVKNDGWHYIDIPRSVERGDAMNWCPPLEPAARGKGPTGCVINALEHERNILFDKSSPPPARAEALRYVIHFVGDMHQPLHTTDEAGGNCTSIQFFSDGRPTNLHSLWDSGILRHDLEEKHATDASYAAALDERFASDWRAWGQAKPDFNAWVWASHDLARNVAYGDLNPPIPVESPDAQFSCDAQRKEVAALHIAVAAPYFNAALPVIDEQLAKAGYRLAGLLNQAF